MDPRTLPPEQRVVVTGMGAVTPSGLNMKQTWEGVRDGRCRLAPITRFDTSNFLCKIAGEAHGFDPVALLGTREARRTDRMTQFSVAASDEAVADAELVLEGSAAFDFGVSIGNGAGGIETYSNNHIALNARGPRALSPLLIPSIISDANGVQVSVRANAKGPNFSVSSACSTGLDGIGLGYLLIRSGQVKGMICGGSEAAITPLGIGGFDRMTALSRRNDAPQQASRPFDRGRDGFVLSEGAAVVVLESLAHARARDARILAELRSYCATADARHLTQPDLRGEAAGHSILRSIELAGFKHEDIDYIAAHGTGTPIGDPIEANVLRTVLGEGAKKTWVSATKGVTGHLLGAAGSLSFALTVCALRDQTLPPTINLTDPDPPCELRHVANVPKATDVRVALVSSYGFGGHNTCTVLTGPPED